MPPRPRLALTVLAVAVALAAPAEQPASHPEHFYTLDPQRGTYSFGYDTGSLQHQSFREETRAEDGAVHGAYGYVEAGVLRITEYSADQSGYRCRQTVRYLVHPDRGIFVSEKLKASSPARNLVLTDGFGDSWETARGSRHFGRDHLEGWEARPARPPQPARVLGKKVVGHYKDFTSEPAVGGTGAVSAWNSAHAMDLHDEEVFDGRGRAGHVGSGGARVWPVTEDGRRVIWQPVRQH